MKYFRSVLWILAIVSLPLLFVMTVTLSIGFFTGIFVKIDVSHNIKEVSSDHYTYEVCYLKIRICDGGMQVSVTPHMPHIPRASPPDWFEFTSGCQPTMTYPLDTTLPQKRKATPNPDGTVTVSEVKVEKIPGLQRVHNFCVLQKAEDGTELASTTTYWSLTCHVLPIYLLWLLLTIYFVHKHRQKLGREREGLCPKCDYDLSASSGCCPECGQTITRAL